MRLYLADAGDPAPNLDWLRHLPSAICRLNREKPDPIPSAKPRTTTFPPALPIGGYAQTHLANGAHPCAHPGPDAGPDTGPDTGPDSGPDTDSGTGPDSNSPDGNSGDVHHRDGVGYLN